MNQLFKAAQSSDLQQVCHLLTLDNVDDVDYGGWTVLHYAALC
jgi:hypothetical protein